MKKWIPAVVMLFILFFYGKVNAQGNTCEVHFIDTGQSDCILIKGTNRNYLIDTGLPRTYDKVLAYLNSQGINKLEEVIITHYHDDHFGGLEKLVEDKVVDKIILPRHQAKFRDFTFSYLKNKNIKIECITENFSIKDNNIDLKVLLTKKEDMNIENNNGAVFLGTIDNIKYAFMADVEKEREKELLEERELLNSKIIKVPHHALDTSSTEELVKAINARIAVVTCDGSESPSNDVIARYEATGAAVFRTDMHGNIIVKTNPENKQIEITASKVVK